MRTSQRPRLAPVVMAAVLLVGALSTVDAQREPAQPPDLADLGPQGPERNREVYGYATADSTGPIVAGQWGTWSFTYYVGSLGVDDGGRIFLLTDNVADWVLQTDRPADANYVSVATTGTGRVRASIEPRRAGPRPYWGGIVITVVDGDLAPGARVTIVIGDRSHGGPGARAPQIAPGRSSEIRFLVDPLNNASPVRLQDSPTVLVAAGGVHTLEAIWPSEAAPGSQTWLLVRAVDEYGNPASTYEGQVVFEGAEQFPGVPRSYRFTPADRSFHRFAPVTVPASGMHRLRVVDADDRRLAADTNVLTVVADASLRPYCGDLHGQHPVSPFHAQAYAEYARGFAGIDFMSWATNDFHVTEEAWAHTQAVTRAMHEPGRFVVFPGYEYSATTARGGDHNVIFLDEGRPLHRSGYVEHDRRGYDPSSDRYTIASLLRSLDPATTLVMPHVGGRRANLDAFDPAFMPFIEVYSDHGQFEWFLRDALARGLRAGFVASSDDAFGKLGDSPPGGSGLFAVHGGLTCVYAESLTRESLWRALKARRVYGTTGERMQVRFRAGPHWMGESVTSAAPVTLSAEASGTGGIERIELFRGSELVARQEDKPARAANLVRIVWRGAASRSRARQTLWRGAITLAAGRIASITRYRLDHPGERLVPDGDRTLEFDTLTAGDEDGVVLEIEAPPEAVLEFRATTSARNQFGIAGEGSATVHFSVPLADITTRSRVFDAGGVDREVAVASVGRDYPQKLTLDWTEREVRRGTSVYWIRVQQADGATAWSSPIFIER